MQHGGAIMLGKTLRRLIRHGRLTIIRPDGDTEQFGELTAAEPRPDVTVRLKGALTSLKLSLHPDLYFGELYVDGALIIERGTLWELLELLGRNQLEQGSEPGNSAIGTLQAFLSWMREGGSRRAARRHVTHHYDLPHEHYRRFLDADLQYSCAYFADPSFSLEQAQEAKKRTSQPSFYWSRASGCSTLAADGAASRFPWPRWNGSRSSA